MRTKSVFSFVILFFTLTIQPVFSQWQQTSLTTGGVSNLIATESNIFAHSDNIYITSNGGLNWTNTSYDPYVICSAGNILFSSRSSYPRIVRSTDNSASWDQAGIINADGWFSIIGNGNNVFASRYVIQRSTDGGVNWSILPGISSAWMECMAASGSLVFALKSHTGLYRSTNNGDNWSLTTFPGIYVNTVSIGGSNVFTGTNASGIYVSTNSGETWAQTALNSQRVESIAIDGNNIFAATVGGGIYISANNGLSWVQKNEGLTNLNTYSLLIKDNYLYAGTDGAGVWKRGLSELVGVNIISSEVPNEYYLNQNYPNPFNPTTNIKFSIPVSGLTTLNIYDAGGRLINTLVNSELKAGTYEADFDGTNFASGIYFYTLSSGDFNKTNKMILVK